MSRFDTVLFDLDGTLLNTLPDIAAALNHALTSFGRPTHTTEAVRSFVGNGVRRLITRALPDGEQDPRFGEVLREYNARYAVHGGDHTEPYDGIPALLDALQAQGIRLGVATNKPHVDAEPMIQRFFGDTIAVTVGKKDGRRPKPAPDAVEDALAQLGADPARTLYVGDSEVDFQTAENAGLACVLVSWGYRDRAALSALPALGLIDCPSALPAYL